MIGDKRDSAPKWWLNLKPLGAMCLLFNKRQLYLGNPVVNGVGLDTGSMGWLVRGGGEFGLSLPYWCWPDEHVFKLARSPLHNGY